MKMRFRFILLLAACIHLGHLTFLFAQNQTPQQAPALVCEQKNLLFFFQGKDLPLPQNLVCHNQGKAPLLLTNLSLGNKNEKSFLFQSPAQKKILPGQTFSIQLSFRPNLAQLKPAYQNELIFASNDPKQPLLHILIKAEDNPNPLIPLYKNIDGILEKVTSLDFVQTEVGPNSSQSFFLRKNSSQIHSPFSVSIEGIDANAFGFSTTLDKTILVGNEDELLVLFKPTIEKRSYSGSLKVSYQTAPAQKEQKREFMIVPLTGVVPSLGSSVVLSQPPQKTESPKKYSYSRFSL